MAAKLDKNLLDVKMFVFFIDTLVSVGALQPFTISICHVNTRKMLLGPLWQLYRCEI